MRMTSFNNGIDWNEMFQRLLEYRFDNGDFLVPNPYMKDMALGQWVAQLRQDYRQTRGHSLSKDQKEKLTQVGFPLPVTEEVSTASTPLLGEQQQQQQQSQAPAQQSVTTLESERLLQLQQELQRKYGQPGLSQHPQWPYWNPTSLLLQQQQGNPSLGAGFTHISLARSAAVDALLQREQQQHQSQVNEYMTQEQQEQPRQHSTQEPVKDSRVPVPQGKQTKAPRIHNEKPVPHKATTGQQAKVKAPVTTAITNKASKAEMKLLPRGFCPGENDVIFGKGKKVYTHIGNYRFRQMIQDRLPKYRDASKLDRSFIVSSIVSEIRERSPKAGFVKFDESKGRWYQVGVAAARLKTTYSLWDIVNSENKDSSNQTGKNKNLESQNEGSSSVAPTRQQLNDKSSPSKDSNHDSTTTESGDSVSSGRKQKESNSTCKGSSSERPTALSDDFVPGPEDVIIEKGNKNYHHAGNARFRKLVDDRMMEYSNTVSKVDKSYIVSCIVNEVRERSPMGGFVKRDAQSGRWSEIGDFLAREKTSQALRNALGNYKSSSMVKQQSRKMKKKQEGKQTLKKTSRKSTVSVSHATKVRPLKT